MKGKARNPKRKDPGRNVRAGKMLWTKLQRKRLGGLKFTRQHVLGAYTVDFYCPDRGLAIELEGKMHITSQAEDALRAKRISQLGVKTISFRNAQVLHTLDLVLKSIAKHCGFKDFEDVEAKRKAHFSTFPQRQQSQGLKTLIRTDDDDESCGKVEKPLNYKKSKGIGLLKKSGYFSENSENSANRPPCKRQVYASKDVAARMVENLKKLRIMGTIEVCKQCGLIHVQEVREARNAKS
jgi:very-short-patch-repair endonuclease